jgi:hypothetical protein
LRGEPTRRGRGINNILSAALTSTICPARLVNVHPVRVAPVLPCGGSSSALGRVLLLPQTVSDVLEYHIERFLVLGFLARFGGAVFRERDELGV